MEVQYSVTLQQAWCAKLVWCVTFVMCVAKLEHINILLCYTTGSAVAIGAEKIMSTCKSSCVNRHFVGNFYVEKLLGRHS